MQDHVNDLIIFADILGRLGQKLVHNFTKQTDISTRVVAYTSREFRNGIFMLTNSENGIEDA